MGSGAMIYIPSSINIDSGVQKLMGEYTCRHRQQRDVISVVISSK
jgi:hypothetical protein